MKRIVNQHTEAHVTLVTCCGNNAVCQNTSADKQSLQAHMKLVSFFILKRFFLALIASASMVLLMHTGNKVYAQACPSNPSPGSGCGWSGPGQAIGRPPCGSFTQVSVGSGTYNYFTADLGDTYTISTCGSSFDTQLTIYWYNGSSWVSQAYNDDSGPDCSGTTASILYHNNVQTTGNFIAIVNRFNCQQHDFTGVSAVLKYRDNGPCQPNTPSGGGTYCNSATLTTNAQPANVTYYWQTSPSGTSTSLGSGSSLVVTASGTYYVRGLNNSSGCWGPASGGVTVTINTSSVGGTVSPSSQTICADQGFAVQHTLSGHTGSVVRWEYIPPGGSWTNWGGGGSTSAPSNCCFTSIGTWQVRALVQNGVCPAVYSSAASVVVVADPSVTASGTTTICSGGSATLTASGSGGTGSCGYQWQYFDGSSWVNLGTSSTQNTGALTSTTQYRVLYSCTGSNCDQAVSNTVTVTVVADPSVSISAASTDLCYNQSTTLTSSVSGGTGTPSYQWQYSTSGPGGPWTNGGTGASENTGNLTASRWYRLLYNTSGNGCTQATSNVVKITVDETFPVINCPGNITDNVAPGTCAKTVTYSTPTVSDNCGIASGPTLTSGQASGTSFPKGTTTNVWSVSDTKGNVSTCSFTVTIVDNELPNITCPSNITVNTDPGQCYATISYNVSYSDNCPGATLTQLAGLVSGSQFPKGVTTNTFRVTDAVGQTRQCSFTVTVNDNELPVFTSCPSNITTNTGPGACQAIVNYIISASDNCPGLNTVLISGFASGSAFPGATTTTVTYRATDASGNSTTCSFNVTVVDDDPPVITCPSNIVTGNATNACSAPVTYPNPTATDNCIGLNVQRIAGLASGSSFPVGTTTVTYKATDNFANSATCSFTVTVNDVQPPTAICKNITVNLSAGGTATIVATDINNGSSDNCGIASYSASKTSFNCSDVGNNSVILTVTDLAPYSNTSTCTATVKIQDVTPPVALCKNITIQLSPAGTASITPAQINNGSSDACGITLSLSKTNFGCSDVGSTPVTLTVTDPSGNASTCVGTVTTQDVTPPVAQCKNITIQLNASGTATITPAQINNGSSDACGVSLAASKTSFNCSNVGNTNVILTVSDPSGNTATCTAVVTTQDNVPPVAQCKNITVNLSSTAPGGGSVSITGTQVNNGSSDACGIASYAVAPNTFTCANVGGNTVTLTVTDVNGNSSTCSATVTVQDITPPNALCKDITIQLDANGNQSITAVQVDNGSNDNCAVQSLSVFPTTFDCADVGVQTAVLTVYDVNGNNSTCISNVTVQDVTPPTAVCRNYTIELDFAGTGFVVPDTINNGSSDACGIASLKLTATTDVDTFVNASQVFYNCNDVSTSPNPIVLTVTDVNGNTSTCSATVTVLDNLPPILECYNVTKNNDPGQCQAYVSVPAVDINDNCLANGTTVVNDYTGTNDASATYPVGVTTVTWTVTDNFGNTETCSFTVTVIDNEPPTYENPQNIFTVTDPGECQAGFIVPQLINVADNCGIQSVTNSYTGTNNASGIYPEGITVVTWTVTDINGNSTIKTQFILVIDLENPTFTSCPADITVNADPGLCKADVTLTAPTATDNCGVALIIGTVNSVVINGSHDDFPVGTTTINWKALDVNGNWNTNCYQNITVVDNQPPTVTCPANITQNTDAGVCEATVSVAIPQANDNCGVQSLTNNKTGTNNASGVYPLGVSTVTYTVTDVNGLTATCSFTVTVNDNELPSITCPPSQTVNTDPGNCSASVTIPAPVTADNCGVDSYINDYNFQSDASDVYNVGTTTVQWTVLDVNGNAKSCSHTITVVDNEPPTITCAPDQTHFVDAGQCGANVTVVAPTVGDNCAVDFYYNDYTFTTDASAFYPVGTTTLTWGIFDVNGNYNECFQTITVVDNEAPVLTCAPDQVQSTDPGECQAYVAVNNATVSDNCQVDFWGNDLTFTDDASGIYGVGTVTLTWFAIDIYGNYTECTQNITVVDDELPTFICAADQVQTADPGECQALVTVNSPFASDNCGVDFYYNDYNFLDDASDYYPVGTTTLTWTVFDVNGNLAVCTQNITVTDDEAPQITCDLGQTQTADPGVCTAAVIVNDPIFTSDNCGVASVINSYNGTADASDTYPVGTTTVVWTVTDIHGNTATCTQDITITDDEVPSITCAPNQTQTADAGFCGANVNVADPSTADNCAVGSVINDYNSTSNANDFYPVGTTVIVWTVTDVHGNTASCTQSITVTDNENPTITCPANITQTADAGVCNAAVTVAAPSTADNCGVAGVANNYNGTADASDTYPVGTTTVVWTVTDIYGNTAQCSQNITITDNENPTITCPANIVDETDPGQCVASIAVFPNPTVGDNCAVAGVVNSYNGTSAASDVYPLGLTTVVWTVTDVHGNTSSCSMTVTIQDNELPQITCPANVNINSIANACNANAVIGLPATSDNCGVASAINDYNGGPGASDNYPVGVTTVTYTVTDVNGNTNTCSFTVTVNDVQAPSLTCPSAITQTADPGVCEAVITFPIPATGDNCGVASLTNSYNNTSDGSDVYPVGSTTVIWTVTDVNGNTTTCSQLIIVTDDEDPTITCAPDQVHNSDPGACSAAVTVAGPTTADNCAVASVVNSYNGTNNASDTYPVGTTTITWTVTDIYGHQSSCQQDITVEDHENPTITCPADITQTADPSVCGADLFIAEPVVNDNCGVASVVNDYTGGSNASATYSVGTTTVGYTVTDVHGNASYCFFTVVITDDEPPVVICPPHVMQTADSGLCGANVAINYDAASISDNCGFNVDSISNTYTGATYNADGFYPVGTTVVTFTVPDIYGNTSTCSMTVTITDNEAPTITCPANIVQTADPGECEAGVSVPSPVTGDNCAVASVVNNYNGTSDASDDYNVGTTMVTYTVTDIHGNNAQCSFTITITDNEAPAITCPANINQTADPSECSADIFVADPAVSDNCAVASYSNDYTGTNNASANYIVGTTTVTYTVTDIHGNSSQCFFTVTITDDEPPVVQCFDNVTQFSDAGQCGAYVEPQNAFADDNCGLDWLNVYHDYPGGADQWDPSGFYPVGTTTVTFTVPDIHGNVSTCSFTVTIIDDELPTITCPADIIQTADPGLCTAAVTVGAPTVGDNCVIASVTNDYNGTSDASDTYDVGVTTVVWTVVDTSGNQASCAQSILITDDEDPVIYNCPSDINVIADPSDCNPQVFWTPPTASDNCSYTLTSNYLPGDEFDVDPGSYAVNYVAVDPSGNTAVCNFVVNVDPTPLVVSHTTSQFACGYNISCNGANDGSIDLTVNGACLPYTFTWTGPNGFSATTEDISGLGPGQYCYTVTDSRLQGYPGNGQSASGCITLTEPDALLATAIVSEYECGYQISCYGANDGSIDVSVNGGCGPYTYTWTTPNGSGLTPGAEDQTGLGPGSYRVVIKDQNNCTVMLLFNLQQPNPLVVTDLSSPTYSSGFNVSCYGASDGSINLDVTGGAMCEPYTYQWTGPDSVIIVVDTIVTNTPVSGYAINPFSGGNSSSSSSHSSSSDGNGGCVGCNVYNSVKVTGAPDNYGARWEQIGDRCVFELDDELPAGTTYTIRWRQKPGQSGTSVMKVAESSDGVAFATNGAPVSTTTETYFNQTFVTTIPTRYVRIESNASPDFEVDAISYSFVKTTTQVFTTLGTGGPFNANVEDLTNIWAGTYYVTITDANGCSIDTSITLTQPDPLDLGICADQTVAYGYYPENVAQITTNVTGALPPYTYQWSTGDTTPTIIVAPQVTTTYYLTVTSANGCIGYGSHTVNVVDVRCGSALDRVSMCNTSNKNYCIKVDDVANKLAQGWKIGSCPGVITNSADCGEPVVPPGACNICHPSGHIKYMLVEYRGPSGATVRVRNFPQMDVFQTFYNVQQGDQLLVNGTLNNGNKLSFITYMEIVDAPGPYAQIPTDCANGHGADIVDHIFGDFKVLGLTDTKNNTCGMSAPCPCSGGIAFLGLIYTGEPGGTVTAYAKSNHTYQLGTYSNLQPGDTIVVRADAAGLSKLNNTTYFTIAGYDVCDLQVHTSCSDYLQGVSLGDQLTVFGFIDKDGQSCNMPEQPKCLCNGGISSLVVHYTLYDSLSVEDATVNFYADPLHNTLIATFTDMDNGESMTVSAAGLPGGVFGPTTYVEIVGSGRPDIKLPTNCTVASDQLIGGSFRELFIETYVDAQGFTCDNGCGIGKTLMCHDPAGPRPPHEHCVKNKDVSKKLQHGDWALGPCSANAKPEELLTSMGDAGFELSAQPNPFSESTTIRFRLKAEERVSLKVYNVAGEEVQNLFEGVAEKDKLYEFDFKTNARADGMYFYRLVTESGDVYVRKLVQTQQ
ncbi:MAG: hypothetical protein KatS3mg031_1047 [Chitinophagales bacterium]|nr:MAG: hypothetical protein KatS3mg031_1047 [Chitinophagales bacterium]